TPIDRGAPHWPTTALPDCGAGALPQPHHVEGDDRFRESLEREFANRLHLDEIVDLGIDALGDQNLPAPRLVAQPGCEIQDRADGAVVKSPGETDLPQCRVAEGDSHAEAKLVAALAPD